MRLLYHRSQKHLLVCGLDLREVAFEPIELTIVWHVVDLCDVQFLKQLLPILCLMDTLVIKEQSEIITSKLLR